MRYSTDHKQETKARVLKEASRALRAKGPDGVSVSGIMARLGLTHGGFYAHFKSKDELIVEAIGTMFDDARARFERSAAEGDPGAALEHYISFYLSTQHRDARERGCPLAALSSDLSRLDAGPRARFAAGVDALTTRLADALERHGIGDSRQAASSMLAELVGALSLSRAVADPDQSEAILASSAKALRARFGLGEHHVGA